MAISAGISNKEASKILDIMIGLLKNLLIKGDSLSINEFGTLSVRKRKARSGRNPKTGESLYIKRAIIPSFRFSKKLEKKLGGSHLITSEEPTHEKKYKAIMELFYATDREHVKNTLAKHSHVILYNNNLRC